MVLVSQRRASVLRHRAAQLGVEYIEVVDGTLRAGDRIVVRGGETLRGAEKLDIVGVLEDETRSATAVGAKPRA